MKNNIFFLDLEASSLSWNSYPIEIAWGNSLGTIQSYLISPESIKEWDEWSIKSEKIHGIKRTILLKKGYSPHMICDLLAESLTNKKVYTDNPCWDSMWLYKLFQCCNKPIPHINIRHIEELLIETICPGEEKRIEKLYFCLKLQEKAREKVMSRHRAMVDVEYLIHLYSMAKEYNNNE